MLEYEDRTMITDDILDKLICFSDEEIDHLNGVQRIDKSIFIDEKSNIVDANKLLASNEQFSIRKHPRFLEYPKHRHNYLELMYVYGGVMTTIIDNKEIVVHRGELLLLNQNIEHSINYTDENDLVFNFIIKPEFLEYLASMVDEKNEIFNFIFKALYSYDNDGEYLLFKVGDNEMIRNYLEMIIMELYYPKINHAITLKLLVGLLLSELMNYPEKIEFYQGDNYEKLLTAQILKYIGMNYQDGSLSELAMQLHQPDYRICKIIKRQTGKTFKQLLQDYKVTQAAQLLKMTTLSIDEIIDKVGYENNSYFYRIFKDKYRLTPNEYRYHDYQSNEDLRFY